MEAETQVFSDVDPQKSLEESAESCRQVSKVLRKEKDRQNLAQFGTIGFEAYLKAVADVPPSVLRIKAPKAIWGFAWKIGFAPKK